MVMNDCNLCNSHIAAGERVEISCLLLLILIIHSFLDAAKFDVSTKLPLMNHE